MYNGSGYSANVSLRLRVNGCLFPLTHAGRDFVIFKDPTVLPEGDAELIVNVDGHETRRLVTIHDRDTPRREVPIELQPLNPPR
jgi:hypothetical protein